MNTVVDTNSVIFKSKLFEELFKNGIDYDTAIVLYDCIKIATKDTVNKNNERGNN